MAAWCLMTGQSVDTYLSLTTVERAAFRDVYVRIHSR